MSSTTTRNQIGSDDINFYDGINDTFTRQNSTGGLLTLNKIGYYVDVAEAYGAGTISQAAIVSAINQIGVTRKRTLLLKAGTWSITSNLTIPSNFTLIVPPGATFAVATGVTLTINSPIEAGPYQIFSWTGTGAIALSGSPTKMCPVEWFGGVAGTSNDCAAAFTKMGTSIGAHQSIFLSSGEYRIASSVVFTGNGDGNSGFNIDGLDNRKSKIYIDVGLGNDGVSFQWGVFNVSNISFVGPADCCQNGVVLGGDDSKAIANGAFTNVSYYMGASAYALKLQGVIKYNFYLNNIGQIHPAALGYTAPVNGVYFAHPPTVEYSNNVIDMDIAISTLTGIGIYVVNAQTATLRGSIEACNYPLYVDGDANTLTHHNLHSWVQFLYINNMYILDGNTNNIYIKNANYTTIDNPNNETGPASIINCFGTFIRSGRFVTLFIDAACQKTVLGNVGVGAVDGTLSKDFINEAQDTISLTPTHGLYFWASANQVSSPPQAINYLSNSALERWTASVVDGWTTTNVTVTQCGTGLIDTTNHNTTFCAKLNTNGGAWPDREARYTLAAAELKKILGKHVTFSMYIKASALPSTLSGLKMNFNALGEWAALTAYNVGDCVTNVGSTHPLMFKCVTAGTTAAGEPTWPDLQLYTVTDGTVTWQAVTYPESDQKLVAADVGKWRHLSVSGFVPLNATAMYVWFPLYQTGVAADITYYISEPCLTPGGWAPSFVAPTQANYGGTFTCDANTNTVVPDVNVKAGSRIQWTPTNVAAATLEGAATKLYNSAKSDGTSFTVTTGDGNPAAGTETFDYLIVN